MIIQCANCKRVRHGGVWECPDNFDAIEIDRRNVSHGACPDCRDAQLAEIRRRRGERPRVEVAR